MQVFDGFPFGMEEFFMMIRFNNNAVFFEEHRSLFERDVKAPLYALAEALAPSVLAVDPSLETRPSRVVSRIRRDTRFSHDKSPYRDHMWIGWRPVRTADSERKQQIPGLYFSVSLSGWDVGVGYYEATPATMKAFRARMLAAPSSFRTIIKEPAFADSFTLHGEEYKRPPAGMESIPDDLAPWYKKKSFYVEHAEPLADKARTAGLVDTLTPLIAALAPMYQYLCTLPIEELRDN